MSKMARGGNPSQIIRLFIAWGGGILVTLTLLWWANSPTSVTADDLSFPDCESYPIAVHADSVDGLQPGDSTGQIYRGAQAGQFGWLLWNPDRTSETYLVEELRDPGLSLNDFTNAMDPSDHSLSAGDWVLGFGGMVGGSNLRDELDRLVTNGTTIRIIVWDAVAGSGGNISYRVGHFLLARVTDYGPRGNWITLTYMGETEDPESCRDFELMLEADGLQAGLPGQSVWYTHTLTNGGHYTETVVLTYTSSPADWLIWVHPISATLGPGQGVTVTALLTIPLDSAEGELNVTHITASLVVSNAVVAAVTDTTVVETPIVGLFATNDSPTPLGSPTTLTATVMAGNNVTYTWAFGDGHGGWGAIVTHVYPAVGAYTAVVTASNGVSVLTATTPIAIHEPDFADPDMVTYLPVILRFYPGSSGQ